MRNYIKIDSLLPNSYTEIRDYLYDELTCILKSKRPIIFLCIGTDRSTGDSLGPLVGHKLKEVKRKNLYIYGSLNNPIHAKNLSDILEKIQNNFTNPYIVAIDSSLGNFQDVGKIVIDKTPLSPGLALGKNIPPIGDMSIKGIVNISGNFEFMILQNTRLSTVMTLADCISNGIYHFILKAIGGKSSLKDNDDMISNSLFP